MYPDADETQGPAHSAIVTPARFSPRTNSALYTSVEDEYAAIAARVGLVDRSYLSKLKLTGRDVIELLQRLSTNDLTDLRPGMSCHTVLTTEKGRVIDVVTLYCTADASVILLCHAPARTVQDWIQKFIIMEDVTIANQTSDYTLYSLFGPGLEDLVPLTDWAPRSPWRLAQVIETRKEGIDTIIGKAETVCQGGVNILSSTSQGELIWKMLLEAGAIGRLMPCGSESLEIHRVEHGLPMYGRELTQDVNPLEAGLDGYVSFTKGCYIGQEVIARLDTYKKLQRKLIGLVLSGQRSIPTFTRVKVRNEDVGWVTSVVNSIHLGKTVALAYIRSAWAVQGTLVHVALESGEVEAEVVELPFRK